MKLLAFSLISLLFFIFSIQVKQMEKLIHVQAPREKEAREPK